MAFMKLLEESDEELSKTFSIICHDVTQKMDTLFKKMDRYVQTGDVNLLKNDIFSCIPVTTSETAISALNPKNVNSRAALADITDVSNNIAVKQEKLSSNLQTGYGSISSNVIANKHINMCAPTIVPIKKEKIKKEVLQTIKKSTRTKRKPNRYRDETFTGSSSDVVIQNDTITTIDITEEKSYVEKQFKDISSNMSTRSGRNKNSSKSSKRRSSATYASTIEKKLREQEKYGVIQPSISITAVEANATYVLIPRLDASSTNGTVIIENPKIINNNNNSDLELNRKINGINQDIEQTKMYMKQAIEKQCNLNETKNVNRAKSTQNKKTELEQEIKKNQEIEKKKALLQAKSEETRRKRELKQLKAQKLRRNIEEEKRLEIQKLKNAKCYHPVPEKTNKLRQKIEGTVQKKNDKVKINKIIDDIGIVVGSANHLLESVKNKTRRHDLVKLPTYMTEKMPLLPTDDCYDSDESDVVIPRTPEWNRAGPLHKKQLVMVAAGHSLMNTFFCCTAQTPDLEEIFECIDPRKLIRTSSAVWRVPPRYTFLSLSKDSIFSDNWEDDVFYN